MRLGNPRIRHCRMRSRFRNAFPGQGASLPGISVVGPPPTRRSVLEGLPAHMDLLLTNSGVWPVCRSGGCRYPGAYGDQGLCLSRVIASAHTLSAQISDEPMSPAIAKRYPFRYWAMAEKKGYCMSTIFCFFPPVYSHNVAGTAIFSKHKPLSVDKTLPGHPNATIWKGRIITLEYPTFYIVGTYVVNAGEGLKVPPMILGGNLQTDSALRPLVKRRSGINTWRLT